VVDKRLLGPSRHDPFQFNSYPGFEVALSVATATPLTFAQKTGVHVPWIEGLSGSFIPFNAISCLPLCVCQAGT